MKIAIIQMHVGLDKKGNVKKAVEHIKNAAAKGADMAVLPEMFNCPYSNVYFADYAEGEGEDTFNALSEAAKAFGAYVIGGSVLERDGEKVYNTSFVFNRRGEKIARHRKAHLFDIDVKGGQRFFESETFTQGNEVTVFDTEFGKMGLCICFDIRFPEICRMMALKGAKVMFAPSAFNMTTGPLHWETLFKTRAVDNQYFTVGVSPARNENGVYVAYGNSIAVDPWGRIIYRAEAEEIVEIVDIDIHEVERVREQLPLLSAMRHDMYKFGEN